MYRIFCLNCQQSKMELLNNNEVINEQLLCNDKMIEL